MERRGDGADKSMPSPTRALYNTGFNWLEVIGSLKTDRFKV